WFRVTLAKSRVGGATILNRQSSVTIDTQYPVKSIGAIARGVCGGWGASPRCPAAPAAPPPRAWAQRFADVSATINAVTKTNLYFMALGLYYGTLFRAQIAA